MAGMLLRFAGKITAAINWFAWLITDAINWFVRGLQKFAGNLPAPIGWFASRLLPNVIHLLRQLIFLFKPGNTISAGRVVVFAMVTIVSAPLIAYLMQRTWFGHEVTSPLRVDPSNPKVRAVIEYPRCVAQGGTITINVRALAEEDIPHLSPRTDRIHEREEPGEKSSPQKPAVNGTWSGVCIVLRTSGNKWWLQPWGDPRGCIEPSYPNCNLLACVRKFQPRAEDVLYLFGALPTSGVELAVADSRFVLKTLHVTIIPFVSAQFWEDLKADFPVVVRVSLWVSVALIAVLLIGGTRLLELVLQNASNLHN